jgi:hypothetical protein
LGDVSLSNNDRSSSCDGKDPPATAIRTVQSGAGDERLRIPIWFLSDSLCAEFGQCISVRIVSQQPELQQTNEIAHSIAHAIRQAFCEEPERRIFILTEWHLKAAFHEALLRANHHFEFTKHKKWQSTL